MIGGVMGSGRQEPPTGNKESTVTSTIKFAFLLCLASLVVLVVSVIAHFYFGW